MAHRPIGCYEVLVADSGIIAAYRREKHVPPIAVHLAGLAEAPFFRAERLCRIMASGYVLRASRRRGRRRGRGSANDEIHAGDESLRSVHAWFDEGLTLLKFLLHRGDISHAESVGLACDVVYIITGVARLPQPSTHDMSAWT